MLENSDLMHLGTEYVSNLGNTEKVILGAVVGMVVVVALYLNAPKAVTAAV